MIGFYLVLRCRNFNTLGEFETDDAMLQIDNRDRNLDASDDDQGSDQQNEQFNNAVDDESDCYNGYPSSSDVGYNGYVSSGDGSVRTVNSASSAPFNFRIPNSEETRADSVESAPGRNGGSPLESEGTKYESPVDSAISVFGSLRNSDTTSFDSPVSSKYGSPKSTNGSQDDKKDDQPLLNTGEENNIFTTIGNTIKALAF